MVTFIKNIIQLILAPTSGWEDISVSNPDPKAVASTGMYPLFAASALSVFAQGYFHPELSGALLVVKAAATFASFFVGYVIAEAMLKTFSEAWVEGSLDYRKCSTVVIFALSLLALATIVCNLLPLTLGLPYLLPLGVAMVIWKATMYLCVKKDKEFNFMLFMVMAVVMPPCLIRALFDWVIGA
ncbi:MAG: hypothetical protein LIP03_00925 [Bacteroidales bacterium]|nr:hypothetical protein [Bacteroidales bacterium]